MNFDDKFISRSDGTNFPINLSGLVPGQVVGDGRFKLTRLLGQGGMGIVWQAEDERLGVIVALKFLPSAIGSDAAALDLLRAETRRCLKLSHPNIIRIHDLHERSGEAVFFSMEYVDGPTLSALRVQQAAKVLSWEFLAPLVQQLCEALAYAHGEKVIHRDLKPSNLMVDSKGRLKLADFGVASVVTDTISRLTGAPGVGGTLVYMSPQQLQGSAPRVTDDIYSLGATVYELLTSQPPFSSGDISHQVRNASPRRISERLAELQMENRVPAVVEETVAGCLAKDGTVRPQSAKEAAYRFGLERTATRTRIGSVGNSRWRAKTSTRKRLTLGFASAVVALAALGVWWKMNSIQPTKPVAGKSWKNSLGMKFVPVGEVFFSVWETRVQDFEAFVKGTQYDTVKGIASLGLDGWDWHGHSWKNPGYPQDSTYPVVGMRWDDATAFCAWLTTEERKKGWLEPNQRYRLPTDEEWSQAVGEDERQFPWGNEKLPSGAGNYAGTEVKTDSKRSPNRPFLANYSDRFPRAAPVGKFPPNRYGLYDLGGNVKEWCEDKYPVNSGTQILRGGSWDSSSEDYLQSSWRMNVTNRYPQGDFGFRCVLELRPPPEIPKTVEATNLNPPAPVLTNRLGMRFVPVGRVLFSVCETTVQDFAAFVSDSGYDATKGDHTFGINPWIAAGRSWQSVGFPQDSNHPVVGVNAPDSLEFCRWLTEKDRLEKVIGPDQWYRLPTDEEWSQAADTKRQKFPWGKEWPPSAEAGNYGNFPGRNDGFEHTAPVQSFKPNGFGLYDLGGNVAEWCQGRRGNPMAIIARGGSWQSSVLDQMQSSCRVVDGYRSAGTGFRCVLEGPPSPKR